MQLSDVSIAVVKSEDHNNTQLWEVQRFI